MSVTIRLSRVGRRKIPMYRVVAACKEKKRDGRYLEVLGTFNPKNTTKPFNIELDKYNAWVSKGAEPSLVVGQLVAKWKKGGKDGSGSKLNQGSR